MIYNNTSTKLQTCCSAHFFTSIIHMIMWSIDFTVAQALRQFFCWPRRVCIGLANIAMGVPKENSWYARPLASCDIKQENFTHISKRCWVVRFGFKIFIISCTGLRQYLWQHSLGHFNIQHIVYLYAQYTPAWFKWSICHFFNLHQSAHGQGPSGMPPSVFLWPCHFGCFSHEKQLCHCYGWHHHVMHKAIHVRSGDYNTAGESPSHKWLLAWQRFDGIWCRDNDWCTFWEALQMKQSIVWFVRWLWLLSSEAQSKRWQKSFDAEW